MSTAKDVLSHQIAREERGDGPPTGSASWQAYWHAQISEYQAYADSRGQGNMAAFGNEMLTFIRQKRVAAGLPPAR